MPSRNSGGRGHQYNLVQSDDLDTRVPLVPDEAFQQGIQFNCKFIGSMDIPRPASRVEIVAAMRRVRFEFKQKGIKKKKVTVTVSVNGIKTTLRKRKTKKRRIGRNKDVYVDVDNSILIESHPIYRIFYVSHDSQDVKIFAYIARETSTNVFHCCVFKATKKAQAMRIVRTVGQAFEVCHKLVGAPDEDNNVEDVYPEKKEELDSVPSSPIKRGGSVEDKTTSSSSRAHKLFSKLGGRRTTPSELSTDKENETQQQQQQQLQKMKIIQEVVPAKPNNTNNNNNHHNQSNEEKVDEISNNLMKETDPSKKRPGDLNLTQSNREQEDLVNLSTPVTPTLKNLPSPTRRPGGGVFQFGSQNEVWLSQQNSNNSSMAAVHEAHLLREKLEQQQQQTQAALAQINLLRDQLAAESSARIEAQARTHQLLLHNKELLDHLQSLVRHIQELEGRIHQNTSGSSLNNSPAPALPQLTPRVKIERWFQYAALMSEEEAAKQTVVAGGTPSEDDLEEDLHYLEEDNEENHHPHQFLGQRGKVKVRESKRTLVSKGESGFVSDNTLNSASNNLHKRGKYFNFSSSSIFRRVLRLGPRNEGVVVVRGDGGSGRVASSKQNKNNSNKKRRFGRGRRARRADLEAAIMRSGQGIGNKSFIGSNSTVHQNQGLKRTGPLNSSGKSRVSSL